MIHKISWILTISFASLLLISLKSVQLRLGSEFKEWTETSSKKYSSKIEQIYREMVFMQNLEKINRHNADPTQTYTMGVNQFADLTEEEFVSQYLTTSSLLKYPTRKTPKTSKPINPQTQDPIDWLSTGKVSRTRQGTCASIWAFPTASVIQSALLVAGKPRQLLSIQQIIDCSRSYGNQGCEGNVVDTMQFIEQSGITSQSSYPYVGYEQPCQKTGGQFLLDDFEIAIECPGIYYSLSQEPVLVGAEASNWAFYKSGVFSSCGDKINHVVIVVGWTNEYWTVMNNWGTNWGEDGMIRLAPGNTCAICEIGIQPIVIV